MTEDLYRRILHSRDRSIQRLLESLQKKENLMKSTSLAAQEHQIRQLAEEITALRGVCEERNAALAGKAEEITALRGVCEERNAALAGKERELKDTHTVAVERLAVIQQLDLALNQARAALAKQDGAPAGGAMPLVQEAADLRMQLASVRHQLKARIAQVARLERELTTQPGKPKSVNPLARRWQHSKSAWLGKLADASAHPLGTLQQYAPRPLQRENFPSPSRRTKWPRICIATPSYQQAQFLERTMLSVLDQGYPNLAYGVQDGGSTDGSVDIITRHLPRLTHAESAPDQGQADAIRRGFAKLFPTTHDIMGWLNSDDVLMPGTLHYIGDYFARHPEVDVIYGHRVVIDEQDREIGRWFLPQHHADTLKWFDLVPQETMFWRARCYQDIGGLDESFQFALDWDLLLRFEQAGCTIRRLPYFLGCFRAHSEQKTSAKIHTVGEEEMQSLRHRTHEREVPAWEIHQHLTAEVHRSALVEWRHRHGLRW